MIRGVTVSSDSNCVIRGGLYKLVPELRCKGCYGTGKPPVRPGAHPACKRLTMITPKLSLTVVGMICQGPREGFNSWGQSTSELESRYMFCVQFSAVLKG